MNNKIERALERLRTRVSHLDPRLVIVAVIADATLTAVIVVALWRAVQ